MEGPSREVGGGEGEGREAQPPKSPLLARNVLHPSVLLTWATARERIKSTVMMGSCRCMPGRQGCRVNGGGGEGGDGG